MMAIKYDLWAREREAATVNDRGLRVLVTDSPPVAKIWAPKGTKPATHYRFRTIAARDAYVTQYTSNYAEVMDSKQSRRDALKARNSQHADVVDVGHVFVWSWGYDQTNIEYFQVIAKSGQTVTVRPICQSTIPGSEQFMCEHVKPMLGHFIEAEPPIRKRVQIAPDGTPYLSQEYGYCSLWRGESSYQSHYA